MMQWWSNYGHMGFMAVWWFFGFAFIAAVFWLLWRSVRGTLGGTMDDSPDDILTKRDAKGEIDHDTYERMWSDLHPPHGGTA